MHEENSSNELAYEISLIDSSLNFLSEESFNLSNLVVEVEKSSEVSDRDGCHPIRNSLIETNGNNYPHTIHDLVQPSKCDSTIFEISKNCDGFEALQLPLMVMSRSHDFDKPPELRQI